MNDPRQTQDPSKRDEKATRPGDAPSTSQPSDADGGPAMQGEGNYTAARRHRESAESFVESGRVESAAKDAAPDSDAERKEMKAAEEEGRSHARK